MSGQLWGTCPWCLHRKRVIKANGRLYAHDRPGGNFPCLGSHMDPREGSVRQATKYVSVDEAVSLTKAVEPLKLGAVVGPWAKGMTNAEIVEELRDLFNLGSGYVAETYDIDPEAPVEAGPSCPSWSRVVAWTVVAFFVVGFAVGWVLGRP